MKKRAARRVLVTGGAGFVGSHLCERLLDQGNAVICVDNYFTGSRRNVQHLLANPRFALLEHDVTEPLDVDVDRIYNLACPASPIHYQHDPVYTLKTSVLGALNLLDLARSREARILQASTSEVYGDPLVHPQTEDYWGHVNPIGIRACYDEGKRSAETLFFDYRRRHGLGIKVARIFNTYGPRMHQNDGRIVSNFVVQALTGEPLTVNGDGTQTRSLCYVDDLVDALIRLMESSDAVTGPVNLGNPHELPVIEIARLVRELTGTRAGIAFRPLPADDPRRRRPDIRYAEKVLGWHPEVDITTGVRRTIAWFRQWLSEGADRTEALAAGGGRPVRAARAAAPIA